MLESYFQKRVEVDVFPMESADCRAVSMLHGKRFSRAWSDGEFHALLLQSPVFGFVAKPVGVKGNPPLAGFVLTREVAGEAEILTIGVDEKHGRLGLGWRLMQAALREAKHRGAESMFLEVDEQNAPAVGLYRKLGFATIAERKAYYRHADGNTSTALVMSRILR